MIKLQSVLISIFVMATVILLSSCQKAGLNSTGSEYIPDMAHSVAYEANLYAPLPVHTWDEESVMTRRELSKTRKPVNGTIPRGYSGIKYSGTKMMATLKGEDSKNGISVPLNGHVPYYYENSPAGREAAMNEVKRNPFPISAKGLEEGKKLFSLYCIICHGEKGDGNGYLVREDGGKYPAMPRNFLTESEYSSTNGKYYHAIMFGYNVMGSFADKLSYEERWQVIHYIRSLQAKAAGKAYSSEENTLNVEAGMPAKLWGKMSYTDYVGQYSLENQEQQ